MSERFLMGLDLGGGGVRCLLVAPESGRSVSASRAFRAEPVPELPLAIEP